MTIQANINSIALAVLTALVVGAGTWVWKAEARIAALETELHRVTSESGSKVFWKLHAATWSEVNRIDSALNRPDFPWPLENYYSTPQ